jgi:hypothetical protein
MVKGESAMTIGMDYSEDYDPEEFEFDHYMDDEFMCGYHKPLSKRTKKVNSVHFTYETCPKCGCIVTPLMRFCANCYPQD